MHSWCDLHRLSPQYLLSLVGATMRLVGFAKSVSWQRSRVSLPVATFVAFRKSSFCHIIENFVAADPLSSIIVYRDDQQICSMIRKGVLGY